MSSAAGSDTSIPFTTSQSDFPTTSTTPEPPTTTTTSTTTSDPPTSSPSSMSTTSTETTESTTSEFSSMSSTSTEPPPETTSPTTTPDPPSDTPTTSPDPDPTTTTDEPPPDTTTSPPPDPTTTTDDPPETTTSDDPPDTTTSDPPQPSDSEPPDPTVTDPGTTTDPGGTSVSTPVIPTTSSTSDNPVVTPPPDGIITTWTVGPDGSTTVFTTGSLSPEGNQADSFFANRGAVAGVFTFVAVAIVALIVGLWFAWRRRRQRRWNRHDAALAAAAIPSLPLDDDEAAEMAHRRTMGSDNALIGGGGGVPVSMSSKSGHLEGTDSADGHMYEPYSGYGAPPSAFAPFAGTVGRAAEYVPARTHSTSPGPRAIARPISPGYAVALGGRGASSSVGHGSGSSSGHDGPSSMGHALMIPQGYAPVHQNESPTFESPPTSEVHEQFVPSGPLFQPMPDRSTTTSPPVPPRHPLRPQGASMKIDLPPPPMSATAARVMNIMTNESEFPPSGYSHEVGSDDARLDPNLASRLRGGAGMLSGSTPSFRDDQDYSRRLSTIRQNTLDSYASFPSDIRESDREP